MRHHARMDLIHEVPAQPVGLAAVGVAALAGSELWHPDAVLVTPTDGHNGLSFVGAPPRGVLHITVSSGYTPSRSSYFGNPYWPHATITATTIYQHLPINVGGYALAHEYGYETNRADAIQCEVVWPDAADANMPEALVRNIASWVKWVSEQRGVPYDFAEMYRPGVTLASVNSPIRFSDSEWAGYSGWCAHSNVPGGNDHWDANFDVDRIMAHVSPSPPPPLELENLPVTACTYNFNGGIWAYGDNRLVHLTHPDQAVAFRTAGAYDLGDVSEPVHQFYGALAGPENVIVLNP